MGRLFRSPLFLMALTIFIDFTGFGLVIPLLPFWAEHLGANSLSVGLLLTVYALAQFVCTPVLGSLSDRYGRRPIILLSLGIEVISFASTALANSLPLLLLARLIGGIGASNIGSAQAVVSDITPPERRAAGMGVIGAAIGLGFVVGPALGGFLAAHGGSAPFWVAMGLSLLNAGLVYAFLPETRKQLGERPLPHRGPGLLFASWGKVTRRASVARLVLINLLYTLAFTGMEAVFPLLTQTRFGWGAMQNGYIFTYVGLIVVIMQGGLIKQLVKYWGELSLMLLGLGLLGAGLLMLIWSDNLALLLAAAGVLSLGDGAIMPTSSAVLSLLALEAEQGEILGFSQGLGSLGRALGPLIAGTLYTLDPGAPFLAGGVFALVAMLIALSATTSVQPALQERDRVTRSGTGASGIVR